MTFRDVKVVGLVEVDLVQSELGGVVSVVSHRGEKSFLRSEKAEFKENGSFQG